MSQRATKPLPVGGTSHRTDLGSASTSSCGSLIRSIIKTLKSACAALGKGLETTADRQPGISDNLDGSGDAGGRKPKTPFFPSLLLLLLLHFLFPPPPPPAPPLLLPCGPKNGTIAYTCQFHIYRHKTEIDMFAGQQSISKIVLYVVCQSQTPTVCISDADW